MANKRKREDSDLDEPAPGKQILPVANLPKDFDGNPANGMEYLFLVRRDARRLPHITRAHNPYEEPVRVTKDVLTKAPCDTLPCEKWRTSFQRHFSNLRMNLRQPTIHVCVRQENLASTLIPEKKDRDAWWMFLTGRPESEWGPAARAISRKKSKQPERMGPFSEFPRNKASSLIASSAQETEEVPRNDRQPLAAASSPSDVMVNCPERDPPAWPTPQDAQAPSNDTEIPSHEVTPNRLRCIDHRMSIHLLMYFSHWINLHLQNYSDPSTVITNSHARWMFSLLTKVEDTVSADEMSLLRNLARACLGIVKKRRDVNSECVGTVDAISDASCWIIFTAIASFWGQKDLWMDAETTMSES